MKNLIIIVFFLLASVSPFGQSLNSERVNKIKASTVRILIGTYIGSGSGFFIDSAGKVATCWHVVLPALQNKLKIFIETNCKDTIEVNVPDYFMQQGQINAVAYDYCILTPISLINKKTPFLLIGNYSKQSEGQEVYTCGYPLGGVNQFISKGIISTKYTYKENGVIINNQITPKPRDQALLDITLNRGNSGGAILKLGSTIKEDVVIGMADFIVSPIGNKADSIINVLSQAKASVSFGQIDANGNTTEINNPNKMGIIFAQAIGSMSIGVGGCTSINYLLEALKDWKKK